MVKAQRTTSLCLSSMADMKMMHYAQFCNLSCVAPYDSQKSDHFPLQLDLACTAGTSSNNARSSPSQPSTCPQFKRIESLANAYQQYLTVDLLMHLVPLLTGTIDVDTVVVILIMCMTEAAQQTLPHKQKTCIHIKFPRSPLMQNAKLFKSEEQGVLQSRIRSRKADSCAMLSCCDG